MHQSIKFWLVLLAVFILGLVINPNVKFIPQLKSCPREATWKKLKEIDDKILVVAADSFSLIGDIFEAQSTFDFETTRDHINQLNEKSNELRPIINERLEILESLGYR